MATYFVTSSQTATWDEEPRNRFKSRSDANARAEELIATSGSARIVRWENNRVVKDERFTDPSQLGAAS